MRIKMPAVRIAQGKCDFVTKCMPSNSSC